MASVVRVFGVSHAAAAWFFIWFECTAAVVDVVLEALSLCVVDVVLSDQHPSSGWL